MLTTAAGLAAAPWRRAALAIVAALLSVSSSAAAEEPDAGGEPDEGAVAPVARQALASDGGDPAAAPLTPAEEVALARSTEPPVAFSPAVPADPPTISAPASATQTRFVRGLNGFANFDNGLGILTFVNPGLYGRAYGELQLHPGFGFQLAGLKLAATADWALAFLYTLPDTENGRRLGLTSVALRVSAPELLNNAWSHLSFTPSIGFTVPVALIGVASELSTRLRLEWAFRMFEVGYFVELTRLFHFNFPWDCQLTGPCGGQPTVATLRNTLLAELRPSEKLSFGVRLSLENRWPTPNLTSGPDERLPGAATPQRVDYLGTVLFASFSFTRVVGVSLSMSRNAPLLSGTSSSSAGSVRVFGLDNNTTLIASVWVRSHAALSKYWLW